MSFLSDYLLLCSSIPDSSGKTFQMVDSFLSKFSIIVMEDFSTQVWPKV